MNSLNEPIVEVQDLSAVFPDGREGLQALDRLSFKVWPQEFVCILGPSASGKSTLLRIVAGLLKPSSGEVSIAHKPIDGPPEGIGFVFQDANLMPWRSVLDNITLPLELEGMPKTESQSRARDLIELVGLTGFESWLPRDLSGGMAQRVAIARSLVHQPDILLLDEPFGALDAITRDRMGAELLRIWHSYKKTVLMVTHSIQEAVYLADRVLVLSPRPGRLRMDLKIDFPRPRQDSVRYTPEFGDIARQLKDAIG